MIVKFTKGSWKINKTGPHWNSPDLTNIEVVYGDIGEAICDTVYEEADAHLIAAAPEMYELLELAMSLMDGDSLEDFAYNYQEIKSVLAKARGESP